MSEILDVARDVARALVEVGAMDEATARKLDALCLQPPISPQARPLSTNASGTIRSPANRRRS